MKWHRKKFTTTNAHIPPRPGIYIIGSIIQFYDLPLQHDYVYVGQSKNLRRRLDQHSPWKEVNPSLEEYVRRQKAVLSVWYTTDLGDIGLDNLERDLIRKLQPVFNRILYQGNGRAL